MSFSDQNATRTKGWKSWKFVLAAVVLLALVAVGVWKFIERQDDLNVVVATRHVNMNKERIAIKGYDPVAYFTEKSARKGKSTIRHNWNGAAWFFMNSEHRELFASNPTKYAPQYGGFCAGGVSIGKAWGSDPEAWAIIGGKLYLGTNKKVIAQFEKRERNKIADKNWKNAVDRK